MELKGSKTEKNLMAAFAGESQARNKYTYYASKAKKKQLITKRNMLNFGLKNYMVEQFQLLKKT